MSQQQLRLRFRVPDKPKGDLWRSKNILSDDLNAHAPFFTGNDTKYNDIATFLSHLGDNTQQLLRKCKKCPQLAFLNSAPVPSQRSTGASQTKMQDYVNALKPFTSVTLPNTMLSFFSVLTEADRLMYVRGLFALCVDRAERGQYADVRKFNIFTAEALGSDHAYELMHDLHWVDMSRDVKGDTFVWSFLRNSQLAAPVLVSGLPMPSDQRRQVFDFCQHYAKMYVANISTYQQMVQKLFDYCLSDRAARPPCIAPEQTIQHSLETSFADWWHKLCQRKEEKQKICLPFLLRECGDNVCTKGAWMCIYFLMMAEVQEASPSDQRLWRHALYRLTQGFLGPKYAVEDVKDPVPSAMQMVSTWFHNSPTALADYAGRAIDFAISPCGLVIAVLAACVAWNPDMSPADTQTCETMGSAVVITVPQLMILSFAGLIVATITPSELLFSLLGFFTSIMKQFFGVMHKGAASLVIFAGLLISGIANVTTMHQVRGFIRCFAYLANTVTGPYGISLQSMKDALRDQFSYLWTNLSPSKMAWFLAVWQNVEDPFLSSLKHTCPPGSSPLCICVHRIGNGLVGAPPHVVVFANLSKDDLEECKTQVANFTKKSKIEVLTPDDIVSVETFSKFALMKNVSLMDMVKYKMTMANETLSKSTRPNREMLIIDLVYTKQILNTTCFEPSIFFTGWQTTQFSPSRSLGSPTAQTVHDLVAHSMLISKLDKYLSIRNRILYNIRFSWGEGNLLGNDRLECALADMMFTDATVDDLRPGWQWLFNTTLLRRDQNAFVSSCLQIVGEKTNREIIEKELAKNKILELERLRNIRTTTSAFFPSRTAAFFATSVLMSQAKQR